jgi:hypothetical protein
VAIKLVLTALSTVVPLIHMRPIRDVAGVAVGRPLATGDLPAARLLDAGAALLVLLVTTPVSAVKPRGPTPSGVTVLRTREAPCLEIVTLPPTAARGRIGAPSPVSRPTPSRRSPGASPAPS